MSTNLIEKEVHGGTGILACILTGTTGFVFSDAARFIFGDWLGIPQAESIARAVLIITVVCAVGILLLWMLRGEWMQKRFYGAWLPGTLLGIPIAAAVGIALGVVSRINEVQGWIAPDVMFRLSRMLSAAAMPLTALACWLYVAIRRMRNRQ